MDYGEINNRWKQFLVENTFKEDALLKKDKKKIKKKENKKEIIVSEDDINEWEEFQSQEESVVNGLSGAESDTNEATDSVEEEEQLEEMSAMSGAGGAGGDVQGYAGNAFAPRRNKTKRY